VLLVASPALPAQPHDSGIMYSMWASDGAVNFNGAPYFSAYENVSQTFSGALQVPHDVGPIADCMGPRATFTHVRKNNVKSRACMVYLALMVFTAFSGQLKLSS
jgi:hypothetical protein